MVARVNPVPVSLCRAMGADVVIAVDLNWDLIGRRASASPSRLNESMDLHAEPPAKTGFSAGGSQESAAYHRRWFGPIKQSIVRC